MKNTTKIPVIKNRVVIKKQDKRSVWPQIGILVLVFVAMLFFVWMQVQTNLQLAEIQKLEAILNRSLAENDDLRAERIRLSSFGRIHKIAERLGLEFLPDENIIEISKR